MQLTTHFSFDEMKCRHCGISDIQPSFMLILERIREEVNFPLIVSSGYRCPEHDKAVGGAGVHPTGLGVDIVISGYRAYRLIEVALKNKIRGVGIRQKGPHAKRIVHLDMLPTHNPKQPRPWVWTY